MSKWTWMQESRRDAQAKGDRERLRMMRVGDEAWGYRESDPARRRPCTRRACEGPGNSESRGGRCTSPNEGCKR